MILPDAGNYASILPQDPPFGVKPASNGKMPSGGPVLWP